MGDNFRLSLLSRLNDLSDRLNEQVLEVQSIASELRMSEQLASQNAENLSEKDTQSSFAEMQNSISRLEELVLNMQPSNAVETKPQSAIEEEPKSISPLVLIAKTEPTPLVLETPIVFPNSSDDSKILVLKDPLQANSVKEDLAVPKDKSAAKAKKPAAPQNNERLMLTHPIDK